MRRSLNRARMDQLRGRLAHAEVGSHEHLAVVAEMSRALLAAGYQDGRQMQSDGGRRGALSRAGKLGATTRWGRRPEEAGHDNTLPRG